MTEYRCRFCGGWVSRPDKLTVDGIKSCGGCAVDTGMDRLLEAIEEANDHLATSLEMANKTAEHGDMRPTTALAFRKAERAMSVLTEVDPTRSYDTDGDRDD